MGTLNGNGNSKWHASTFPEVFQGQPETAWSATLRLLRDITEAQAKESTPSPKPALKCMPPKSPDARLVLKDLADLLSEELKKKRGSADLAAIVTLSRTALEFTPLEHPQRHLALINLADLLFERFKQEGSKGDLDEVIALRRTASESLAPDDPQRQTILLQLNNCLHDRFRRDSAIADLEEIVSLRRVLLEHTPTLALKDLADLVSEELKKKRGSGDLAAIVTLVRTALEFTPLEHPQRHLALINLADLLFERFKQEGSKGDLDEVIALRRTASESLAPDDPQRQTILLQLNDCLHDRFRRESAIADLEEIVSLRRVLLEHTPTLALKDLADLVSEELKKKRGSGDLAAIVTLSRTALEFTPLEHPQRHLALINLADLLSERFKQEGSKEDMDEVITLRRTASQSLAPDDPQRRTILLQLDDCLHDRFGMDGAIADLKEIVSLRRVLLECTPTLALKDLADLVSEELTKKRGSGDLAAIVTLARTALEFTPLEHPQRHVALINLADILHERFKQEGSKEDLDEIIALRRSASESLAPDDPQRQTILLQLDDCLHDRFGMDGAIVDLEEIISVRRVLLERTPTLALKDLADLLSEELKKKRGRGNLSAIVTLARTALEFTPLEHPQRHLVLINLADLLSERFKQEGSQEDLDEVIALRRTASESLAPDDPHSQTILLQLDDFLHDHFQRGHSIADLEEIVSLRRVLLERTPTLNRCRPLLNLADSLHEKFQQQGLVDDIEEAISLAHTASGLCPPEHPDHVRSQTCLARYLKVKVRIGAHPKRAQIGLSCSGSYDIKHVIRRVFFETVEHLPPRLLHTPTGAMCNRDDQLSHFEDSPQYKQLLSSASSLHRRRLQTEISSAVTDFFQVAMLSHRWGSGEPLLRELAGKNIYDLHGTDGLAKLQDFCLLALERNFKWAWSDTCCIDKDSSAELQEAIGSMFSWYRRSSLTIVYLSDVFDAGSLANSVWFRRGWTLQELLASHAILFYTYDWSLYTKSDTANHKTDPTVLEELQKATGVAEQHLTNFYPGVDDARTRLHWASGRSTTRPEDIAYSLFGIFKVHLPVLYGESVENALGRLLAEIISRSGDISVLDWVGEASSFNSCFPANLLPYQTVPDIQVIPSNLAKRNDLGPGKGKGKELYDKLSGLPRAGFANRKLALPSTVHQVTAVKLQSSSTSPSRYTYEINASRLRPVNVTLSVKLCNRGAYLLVRPWHPKSLETQTESDDDAVWNLLGQLGQPFKALLLKRLPHNEYKRIASDCEINACVRDLASTLDTEVLIPEIV
ncbi:hypothetical protein F5J12DRAFT_339063 [Pisolithus orientalis]|uniref:uncharacterized protein n=1 Tax=Pisolithus orientalis TaxID=936130 RepID=UPI002224875E|nr:uncharacterized protein F5J12DRAFT_339063 [Pisolithus orientalis]KAI5997226.1 hypothetical protein F5J12DRAFT_339063 [Pisolithus orientalis]